MLGKYNIGNRNPVSLDVIEAVVPWLTLLRLDDANQTPLPRSARCTKQCSYYHKASRVHIVTAGMHDGRFIPLTILCGFCARISQLRVLEMNGGEHACLHGGELCGWDDFSGCQICCGC